jgi:hypothetical protein
VVRLQRGPKHIGAPIEITNLRELSRSDLTVLAQPRPRDGIKALRDNHHRVARALAQGMNNTDVALTCGISVGRVHMLKVDPAVQELVLHYRSMLTAEWLKEADPVIDFLRSNSLKAAAMISDKLDAAAENDEFLPTRDLLGIAELGFDRTGYGKVNKNVNVNVDFAANLEAARKRTAAARPSRQIEASALRPQSPPDDMGAPRRDRPVASPSFRRL